MRNPAEQKHRALWVSRRPHPFGKMQQPSNAGRRSTKKESKTARTHASCPRWLPPSDAVRKPQRRNRTRSRVERARERVTRLCTELRASGAAARHAVAIFEQEFRVDRGAELVCACVFLALWEKEERAPPLYTVAARVTVSVKRVQALLRAVERARYGRKGSLVPLFARRLNVSGRVAERARSLQEMAADARMAAGDRGEFYGGGAHNQVVAACLFVAGREELLAPPSLAEVCRIACVPIADVQPIVAGMSWGKKDSASAAVSSVKWTAGKKEENKVGPQYIKDVKAEVKMDVKLEPKSETELKSETTTKTKSEQMTIDIDGDAERWIEKLSTELNLSVKMKRDATDLAKRLKRGSMQCDRGVLIAAASLSAVSYCTSTEMAPSVPDIAVASGLKIYDVWCKCQLALTVFISAPFA